ILTLIGFSLILWSISNPKYITTAFLILLNMAIFSIPFIMKKELDFFEPVIIMILMSQIRHVLRPVYWLETGYVDLPILIDNDMKWNSINKGLIYNIIGLLIYYLGYYSGIGWNIANRIGDFEFVRNSEWDANKVKKCIIAFSLVGFMFYCIIVYINGGLMNMLKGWSTRSKLFAGEFYFLWGFSALVISSYILFCFYITTRKTIKKTMFTWIHILFTAILMFTFGGRGRVVSFFLVLLTLYNYLKHKIGTKMLLIFAFLAILFLQAALLLRESTWRGSFDIYAIEQLNFGRFDKIIKSFLERPNFDYYASVIALVPNKVPLQMGRTYLSLLAAPIPRKLWKNKPFIHEGSYVRNLISPEETGGRPIGNIGIFYLNFHIPGIVIGMFILGLFNSVLYSFLKNNINNRNIILLYSILLVPSLSLTNDAFIEFTETVFILGIVFKIVRRKLNSRLGEELNDKEKIKKNMLL
ncbi:MAG: O-antigen polymerase, partial [Candidatus Poribacteria bacterium]